MLKQISFLLFLVFSCCSLYSQNIGVGTSSPQEKLHITGSVRSDALQTATASAAVTDKVVWVDANGKIYSLPAGTPGKVLGVDASGFLVWLNSGLANTLNNGQIWIGDVTNTAQPQTMSGDALLSNTGVITIQDNAVDGTDIAISGESNGSLMYFNGTDWVNLGVGTPGQVLTISGGVPAWVSPPAAPTTGNLTTSTTGVTVAGGTGAVLGAGATVNVATNALNQNGLVPGPTAANALQVWGTDALGNPGWIDPSGLVDVDNGLYFNGGSGRVRQGGALVENTSIPHGNFNYVHELNGSGVLEAKNGASGSGLYVNPSNNVGIGTNNPLGKLHIESGGIPNIVTRSSSTVGTWFSINNSAGGQWFNIISTGSANGEGPGKLLFSRGLAQTLVTSHFMVFDHANFNIGMGTNNPDPSSYLDISTASRGVLFPRVALTATNTAGPITLPATSLWVYNTATAGAGATAVTPGYYYNAGTSAAPNWARLESGGNDWHTTGNIGTTPATNFIGTTDAQDFVFKTSGAAVANERMRIIGSGATPGQVVVNNTGIFAGDVFSVYASNSTNGTTNSINNLAGTFAVNGYASGNGTGVYGEVNGGASTSGTAVWGNLYGTATTASSTSEGLWGTNSTAPAGTGVTAAVATGVRGEASGAAGTAFTMGVLGVNTGVAGSAFGVYGQTSSPSGMGVFGVNLDVSAAPSHGIQGQTGAVGSAAGLRGFNTATVIGNAQNGFGVRGSANAAPTGSGFVMGVRGDASGATGSTYGVYGQSASATGFGMDAVNTNANGTGMLVIGNNAPGTYLTAGSGIAANGNGVGTLSIAKTAASGIGVVAVGNNLTGSIYTPASGSGIAATGTQYGVVGYATTTVNTNPGFNQAGNGLNGSSGGYFEVQAAGVSQTWAYVGVRDNGGVNRKIIGPGTVNTIVNDLQGNKVALSCPETPENLFQDYGQGQLMNGRVHIELDPIFAKNIIVNNQHPLRVFVQLEGNCQGVFVENKTGTGFDVIELNGGTSNVSFSYTVVANRADEANPDGTIARYSEERFPSAPSSLPKIKQETSSDNENVRLLKSDEPVTLPNILNNPVLKHKL